MAALLTGGWRALTVGMNNPLLQPICDTRRRAFNSPGHDRDSDALCHTRICIERKPRLFSRPCDKKEAQHATRTFYVDDAIQRTGPALRPFARLYDNRTSSSLLWRLCVPHESSHHERGLLLYVWSGRYTYNDNGRKYQGIHRDIPSLLQFSGSPPHDHIAQAWRIAVCPTVFPESEFVSGLSIRYSRLIDKPAYVHTDKYHGA